MITNSCIKHVIEFLVHECDPYSYLKIPKTFLTYYSILWFISLKKTHLFISSTVQYVLFDISEDIPQHMAMKICTLFFGYTAVRV